MNLAEIIRSRRSIGAFKNEPVALELVQELLDSAVYAPNHRQTEPWRFTVLIDEARSEYARIRAAMVLDNMKAEDETKRQLAADGTYQKFSAIPLYLLVTMQPHANPEIREEDYAACACVIQNFMLLAWERNLGTSWKTFKDDSRLRTFLGLDATEKVVGIIHIGYSAEESRLMPRQPVHSRMTVLNESNT